MSEKNALATSERNLKRDLLANELTVAKHNEEKKHKTTKY